MYMLHASVRRPHTPASMRTREGATTLGPPGEAGEDPFATPPPSPLRRPHDIEQYVKNCSYRGNWFIYIRLHCR